VVSPGQAPGWRVRTAQGTRGSSHNACHRERALGFHAQSQALHQGVRKATHPSFPGPPCGSLLRRARRPPFLAPHTHPSSRSAADEPIFRPAQLSVRHRLPTSPLNGGWSAHPVSRINSPAGTSTPPHRRCPTRHPRPGGRLSAIRRLWGGAWAWAFSTTSARHLRGRRTALVRDHCHCRQVLSLACSGVVRDHSARCGWGS
jgi:hypothetical protein